MPSANELLSQLRETVAEMVVDCEHGICRPDRHYEEVTEAFQALDEACKRQELPDEWQPTTYYVWLRSLSSVDEIHVATDKEAPKLDDEAGEWTFLYGISAATWEEAMAIHHLRMGFEPYKPAGEPADCKSCDAVYYPEGSGVCWRGHAGSTAKEDAREDPHSGDDQREGT